ncbi:Outer membrane porin protein [Paraburkholderia aspalathi]|jgi:predicted porin|uniref:Outer membrane porin protein n=1 Tax=Paraburkholderia aspalathi TaxID=1324617 RepID=A0ABN7LM69_9BURK|nr:MULTISPECIES: porin [Paraburkholderia]MCP2088683.1 putative porin [Paraburkholderia sediminicola]MBK3819596.1 porin [Paraburkholderia aspalathi]MBK3831495.1 porin [Paraburkholderia aspalathi]MBK3861153.1 porin [Paraburkholderia aspalathi]MCX4136578.1 porin [Paraburkholderia aspalathi]
MKRTTFSIISLAALASAGAAHAQSSVTLYGAIDTSLTYVHNAQGNKNLWALGNSSAGNLSGTRWGLKGTEDLGAGLKAIFQLENGFDPSTGKLGQGSRLFGRQAYVGLTSDSLGSVTLGRQYDPLIDLVQGITEDNYFGSAFATAGDVDNYDNSFRVNNAVKYTSPVWSGLQFEAMYSFGGIAGSTGSEQSYSAAAAYNNGPIALAAGYFYAANSPASAGPRSPTAGWNSTSDGTFDGPINSGYQTAHSLGIARVAGQYTLGQFTLGAAYSNSQYRRDSASVFASNEKYNTGQGFVNYQATKALLVGLGYSYTKSSGDTSATYHQVSLGADYSLSKRTDVYVTAAYQHASGETGNGTGGTMAAQASIGSYGYAGTSTQEMVNLGLRHKF